MWIVRGGARWRRLEREQGSKNTPSSDLASSFISEVDDRDIKTSDCYLQLLSKGTGSSQGRFRLMSETVPILVENSFWIAWDYLEVTGGLGNPDTAARHLLDTIETMIRHGERRRLLLSNTAIASYQRYRAEQGPCLYS